MPALYPLAVRLADDRVPFGHPLRGEGNPNANGTLNWPEFGRSASETVLEPAGDSAAMSIGQIMAIHNCGFWDLLARAA